MFKIKVLKHATFFSGLALLAACASGPKDDADTALVEDEKPYEKVGVVYSLEDTAEESETTGTELVEGTPEDLGEVKASHTRSESEVLADQMSRKTFPMVQNEFVEQWINYFTGRGRRHLEVYLMRSTRYIPMMKKTLRDDGLPEDLIYLAMIESGFNTKARSHAQAVGPWQFIKGTGQRYGLEVDYWVDERRDFIKSTHAAAKYLSELHQIFGTWYLAAAGYNAGEGKVLRAIRRSKTRNFWELSRLKKNFRSETRNYVPKLIAAALISKDPEKYGFRNIPYESPLAWEDVTVPGGVSLRSVAKAANLDLENVQLLNPELVRGLTPTTKSKADYTLRVPVGAAPTVLANLDKLDRQATDAFIVHKVRRGQTLSVIARQYGSSVDVIMDFNNIHRASSLRAGQSLRIPVDEERSAPRPRRQAQRSSQSESLVPKASSDSGQYRVRSGDSWWKLAKEHGVSVKELRELNRALNSSKLVAGSYIRVPR